ncbi:Seryl-tRNA synthetase [Spraguea lophii 42_110]|uniref:serine--tRNA ligase n=1 Tax=Spraguea lophii (strain 42_110) TaxID=1358809 RepID=S7W7W2_SPRLO|nr:Seryl-tRNA synthetase [Spraguea lophii 42_110]
MLFFTLMIDIKFIRDDDKRKLVIKSEQDRFKPTDTVKLIYEADKEKKSKLYNLEQINKKYNALNKSNSELFKSLNKKVEELSIEETKKKIEENKDELQKIKEEKKMLEEELIKLDLQINDNLKNIGNILNSRVPVSKTEDDNGLIREFTPETVNNGKLGFAEIIDKIEGADMLRGAKITGHRGYYLMEELALLATALSKYAVDFLRAREYKLIQPPVMMYGSALKKTSQLSEFEDQLYNVGNEHYLVATSEQPISAFYMDERLQPSELPKKFAGQSLCFRKEAGAHGKDNQGIFRVHQFEKIEQFVICAPNESETMFDTMVGIAEEFYKSLKLKFRVVSIVSGEMNDAASLKYDLEAWFPNAGKFRELVSCSNCTDYQSRELDIRYGLSKIKDDKVYVHMLNATLCAVQRTLCCIVENYQDENGIVIPEALRGYFGEERINFKK